MIILREENNEVICLVRGRNDLFAEMFFKSNGIPYRVVSVSNFTARKDPLASLTKRQREVLQAASEAGYFESPRRKTSREIVASLGIKHSAFLEHLRKAQKKLLNHVL